MGIEKEEIDPALAMLNVDVLMLNVGDRANLRNVALKDQTAEVFLIRPVDPDHPDNGSVFVTAFGYTQRSSTGFASSWATPVRTLTCSTPPAWACSSISRRRRQATIRS